MRVGEVWAPRAYDKCCEKGVIDVAGGPCEGEHREDCEAEDRGVGVTESAGVCISVCASEWVLPSEGCCRVSSAWPAITNVQKMWVSERVPRIGKGGPPHRAA